MNTVEGALESLEIVAVQLLHDVRKGQLGIISAVEGMKGAFVNFKCVLESTPLQPQPLEGVQALIAQECDALKAMLLEKNQAYGNSALDPLRIFSAADATEQIKVRIDDKLSRISRGKAIGEDVILDLLGYLILLRVSQKS